MIEDHTRHYWRLLRALDWWMVGAILLIGVMSVAFVFSATYRGPDAPIEKYYLQQLLWFCAGLCVFVIMALCDYRAIARLSPWFYALGLLLLAFMLVAPSSIVPRVNGAKCWIDLRFFKLQPSEFAKLAYVIFLSYLLTQSSRNAASGWTFLKALFVLVPIAALIVVQPDMGMTAALLPAFFAAAYVAGVRAQFLVWLLVAGLLISPFVWSYGLKDYQKRRLTSFLNPERDLETMMGAGWNLRQSRIAVGSGGLLGEGYLQGGQKLLGYLPRSGVHNDFIFSVYGEEWGFAGSLALLGLYGLLLYRGVHVGLRLRDPLARVMAAGIIAVMFFYVFENIGMQVGLMPITGLPLPLFSYGGSSMLSTMMALGLLQSAYVRRQLY